MLWTQVVLHRHNLGGFDSVYSAQFGIYQVRVGPKGERIASAIDPLAIFIHEHFYQLGVVFDDSGLWQTTIEIDDGMHRDLIVIRVEISA